MEAVPPAEPTMLVTSPGAQFLGSFASDLRQDHRRPAAKRDIKSIVQHYFTESWGDISIWKSAVSYEFLKRVGDASANNSRCLKMPQLPRKASFFKVMSTGVILRLTTSAKVHRAYRNNELMLCVCADTHHHRQLQYVSSGGLRGNFEYFPSSIIHLCTFSCFRRSRQPTHHIRDHRNGADRILKRLSLSSRPDSRRCYWRWTHTRLFRGQVDPTVCGTCYAVSPMAD
jgi:hypothetical protein